MEIIFKPMYTMRWQLLFCTFLKQLLQHQQHNRHSE